MKDESGSAPHRAVWIWCLVLPALVGAGGGAAYRLADRGQPGPSVLTVGEDHRVSLRPATWFVIPVGAVPRDTEVPLTIVVENSYPHDIEVASMGSTCPCLGVDLREPFVLAPGESRTLCGRLRLSGQRVETRAALTMRLRRPGAVPSIAERRDGWTIPLFVRAWVDGFEPTDDDVHPGSDVR